jgi:hypothetical protein
VWQDIQALPRHIQEFVTSRSGLGAPAEDYERALRIGRKLQSAGVSPDEMFQYAKGAAKGRSFSDKNVDEFLSARSTRQAEREQNVVERAKAEARLSGRDTFYQRYRDLLAGVRRSQSLAAAAGTSIEVTGVSPDLIKARDELDADLINAGFAGGIDGFVERTKEYEKAFERETLALALDLLLKYEHLLHREHDRFAPGKVGEATATKMLAQLEPVREPAQALYRQARHETARAASEASGRTFRGEKWGDPAKAADLQREAARHQEAAEQKVTGAVPEHAIVGWQDFPREALLRRTTPEEVRHEMAWFIEVHEAAVQRARNLLTEKPSRVYELDNLLAVAYEAQDVKKGSIYDLVIRDRISQIKSEKSVKDILVAIITIALAVVSSGGGTIGLLAAGAAFGIGTAGALSAVEEYDTKTTLYLAQLLREEPSAAWAIVAVLGVGLDATAVVQALKAVVPAAKTFNASADFVALSAELASVDARVSKNVMEAAKQVHAAEQQLKAATRELKNVFTGAGAKVRGQMPSLALMAAQKGGEILGRVLAVAYYYIKTRLLRSFDRFLSLLEEEGLIVVSKLSQEDRNLLEKAFTEALDLGSKGKLFYGRPIYARLSERARTTFTPQTVDRYAAQGKALGKTDDEIVAALESELQTQERVAARIGFSERATAGGRTEIHSTGRVGDPPTVRPGLERKYPTGNAVGLPDHVRFHVEGIKSIGDELNVVYAPSRFNISETARIENTIRVWRNEVAAVGGELYYDIKVTCRVLGEFEGVTIRVLESITWKLERRMPGTTAFETLFERTGRP